MIKQGNKYTSTIMQWDSYAEQSFPLWKYEVDPDSGEMLWYGYDSPMGYKKTPVHTGEFGSVQLRWLMQKHPERLEHVLDERRFQEYLDSVQERGTDMLLGIVERMMQTDEEYLIALAAGDVLAQMRLRNNFEMCAKEIVREEVCFS